MIRDQAQFPVFEANQVLSNAHLNELFAYLDEEQRLSRANLAGIGIMCGLQLRREADGTLTVTGGVGVTSAGYLAVQELAELVNYRDYTLPPEPDYAPFRKKEGDKGQYGFWELCGKDEPDTLPLSVAEKGFLDDKVLLLFLELRQESLRSCSATDCNDRGAEQTLKPRYLLVLVDDMDKILKALAQEAKLPGGLQREDWLAARLALPDLRMARLDVPNSAPVTSAQLLAAFHAIFRADGLAAQTAGALDKAWQAFQPLLGDDYKDNPFKGFAARFGVLDKAQPGQDKLRYMQNYVDLFDDLLRAYDEMRWNGLELACACCPPGELFPRHLMLGALKPAGRAYRNTFIPACAGDERTDEFRQLFARLVGMVNAFSEAPLLPPQDAESEFDTQVRATPSVYGPGQALGDMALPYYYRLLPDAPLNRLWNPQRTRRGKASHTPGYRSAQYDPPVPAFALEPLRYDLAPYNFLRIEGHLGKNFRDVLAALLELKRKYRLPVDFIAVRTGVLDASTPLSEVEQAQFADLEAVYGSMREVLLSALTEAVRYFYDLAASSPLQGGAAQLPLLAARVPGLQVANGSVGAWFDANQQRLRARPYYDLGADPVTVDTVRSLYDALGARAQELDRKYTAFIGVIYYMVEVAEALPDSLRKLQGQDFANRAGDLLALSRYLRGDREVNAQTGAEDLVDHFDQLLYSAQPAAILALASQYASRVRSLRQRQMLSDLLARHPGVQHKAGVPLGGTFIVVYHGAAPVRKNIPPSKRDLRELFDTPVLQALDRINKDAKLSGNLDIQKILSAVTNAAAQVQPQAPIVLERTGSGIPGIERKLPRALGQAQDDPIASSRPGVFAGVQDVASSRAGVFAAVQDVASIAEVAGIGSISIPGLADEMANVIHRAAEEIAEGTVIADLFLPYQFSGDGGVRYVLPPAPLGLGVALACTGVDGNAQATLAVQGAVGDVSYQLDGQDWLPLSGPLRLPVGDHTLAVRDGEGKQSAVRQVKVPPPLALLKEEYLDDVPKLTYRVRVQVTGGTPPYAAEEGTIEGAAYTTPEVPSGHAFSVTVTDAAGCKVQQQYTHTVPACDLPCGGFARRALYRFWLPDSDQDRRYTSDLKVKVLSFRFEYPPGKEVRLEERASAEIKATADELNRGYKDLANRWLTAITRLIREATSSDDAFAIRFIDAEPPSPTRKVDPVRQIPWIQIEHFECLKFEIRLQLTYVRNQTEERRDIMYTPEGTTFFRDERTVAATLPPVRGERIAKCDPQRPVEPIWKTHDIRIGQQFSRQVNPLIVTAVQTGPDVPDFYVWEATDYVPAIASAPASAPSVTLQLGPATPRQKPIRLFAGTKDGYIETVVGTVVIG